MKASVPLCYHVGEFVLRWKILHKNCVGEIKQFYVQKLFSENRAVYEIVLRNMVQPDKPHIAILYGGCAWRALYTMLCFENLTTIIPFFVPKFSNYNREVKELVG